ncbi:MAG: hypothetical protein AAFU85_14540 [Planctomycetota bacterium]
MKRRFSIRALLVTTALVAVAFGMHAYHAAVRSRELRSIDAMVDLFGPGQIIVSEPGVTYAHDGTLIYLNNIGPGYGRFYGFDACPRVGQRPRQGGRV